MTKLLASLILASLASVSLATSPSATNQYRLTDSDDLSVALPLLASEKTTKKYVNLVISSNYKNLYFSCVSKDFAESLGNSNSLLLSSTNDELKSKYKLDWIDTSFDPLKNEFHIDGHSLPKDCNKSNIAFNILVDAERSGIYPTGLTIVQIPNSKSLSYFLDKSRTTTHFIEKEEAQTYDSIFKGLQSSISEASLKEAGTLPSEEDRVPAGKSPYPYR